MRMGRIEQEGALALVRQYELAALTQRHACGRDLKGYGAVAEPTLGLAKQFAFYDDEHPNQALGNRTPSAACADGNGGGANIPAQQGGSAVALPLTQQVQLALG